MPGKDPCALTAQDAVAIMPLCSCRPIAAVSGPGPKRRAGADSPSPPRPAQAKIVRQLLHARMHPPMATRKNVLLLPGDLQLHLSWQLPHLWSNAGLGGVVLGPRQPVSPVAQFSFWHVLVTFGGHIRNVHNLHDSALSPLRLGLQDARKRHGIELRWHPCLYTGYRPEGTASSVSSL